MSTSTKPNKKDDAPANQSEPQKTAHATCTTDDIRCRAYEIYQARNDNGSGDGDHVSDWLQAERELNGTSQGELAAVRTPHGMSDRSERKP